LLLNALWGQQLNNNKNNDIYDCNFTGAGQQGMNSVNGQHYKPDLRNPT